MFESIQKHPLESLIKLFAAFMLAMILAGCGFQLRGNYTLPEIMKNIYLTPNDPLEPLQKNIRTALDNKGTKISSAPLTGHPIIHLDQPNFSEQVLATTVNAQAQRVMLAMSFSYKITLNDKTLRETSVIKINRELSINPNSPVTAESERKLIREELLSEAANQLLRQLTTVK